MADEICNLQHELRSYPKAPNADNTNKPDFQPYL